MKEMDAVVSLFAIVFPLAIIGAAMCIVSLVFLIQYLIGGC